MPPKQVLNKRIILEASLRIIEKNGFDALNARAIASLLHSSTQPIFTYFESVDSLKEELNNSIYRSFIQSVNPSNGLLQFEMSLLSFANQHPSLFRTLFFSERKNQSATKDIIDQNRKVLVTSISKEFNLSKEKANILYLNNWIYSFGLATLIMLGNFPYKESSLRALIKANIDSSLLVLKKDI